MGEITMKYEPKKELVYIRNGEPLEEELRTRGFNQNEQAQLNDAIEKFIRTIKMSPEQKQAYEYMEEAYLKYICAYGEIAFSLGYSDGVEAGMEKKADGKSTILSVKDMAYLVAAYDAIKELHYKDKGILGALQCILDVIDNGMSTRRKLLEEEKTEMTGRILNDDSRTPVERATTLLK